MHPMKDVPRVTLEIHINPSAQPQFDPHHPFPQQTPVSSNAQETEYMSRYITLASIIALAGWCGSVGPRPPGWVGPWPPPPDPLSWVNRVVNNVYYASLAGLIAVTVATHPEEATDFKTGPIMLIPIMQVAAGLIYNNIAVPARERVKES